MTIEFVPRPRGRPEIPAAEIRARKVKAVLDPVDRWTRIRKCKVCAALNSGLVTRADVRMAHNITDDEIAQWMHDFLTRGWRKGAM